MAENKKENIVEVDLTLETDQKTTIHGHGTMIIKPWMKKGLLNASKRKAEEAASEEKAEKAAQEQANEKAAQTQKSPTRSKSVKK